MAEAPNQYQAVEHIRRGYRRIVCGVDTIYFRLEGEMVEIMRVLGRQDITGAFESEILGNCGCAQDSLMCSDFLQCEI